jgi:CHASE2 domain-containing sensor protein
VRWEWLSRNAEAVLLMVGVSVLSALATWYRKRHRGELAATLSTFIGELLFSLVAGITCGLLLIDHVSTSIMLAAVSVAAQMGTRFWDVCETALLGLVSRRLDSGGK